MHDFAISLFLKFKLLPFDVFSIYVGSLTIVYSWLTALAFWRFLFITLGNNNFPPNGLLG